MLGENLQGLHRISTPWLRFEVSAYLRVENIHEEFGVFYDESIAGCELMFSETFRVAWRGHIWGEDEVTRPMIGG